MAAKSKTAALQHTAPEVQKLRNAQRRRWDAQRDAQRAHRETVEA